MKGIIYKATSPSGKVYIGQTVLKLNIRKNCHFSNAFNKNSDNYNTHFSRAIRKYGKDNFVWDTIYEDILYEKLSELEIKIIVEYNSYHNGYNSTKGGEGTVGLRLSEETKAKISKAHMGKSLSKETREKLSKAHMGKSLSKETREKLSKAHMGKSLSKETREKLSKANSGKIGPLPKLNWDKVKKIRSLHKEGYSNVDIAKLYEVSNTTISYIINNKKWKI